MKKMRTVQSVASAVLVFGVAVGCTVVTTSDNGGGGAGGLGSGGIGASGSAGKASAGEAGATSNGGSAGKPTTPDGDAGGDDVAGAGGELAAGGAPPVAGGNEPCDSAETTPNNDRQHSTPYALGTEFHGCLQNDLDVDFYTYTLPAAPAQGGYLLVSLTDVGADGGLTATTQAAADNGEVIHAIGISGSSVFHWFNGKAGATFRVKVEHFISATTAIPYTLKVAYSGVPDINEPNDTRATATQIVAGKAVTGYLFGGYENSTSVADAAWEDWFKVTLPAGVASIALTDVASDINAALTLYNSLGTEVAHKYSASDGESVVMSQPVTAGDYYVKLTPFTSQTVDGEGSTVPAYLTQPYTFKASVP